MTAVLVLLALRNGVAVALGILGALRPQNRSRYAKWVGRQMLTAAVLMLVSVVIGSLGNLLFPDDEVGHALRGLGLFFGAFVWAACGLLPMTIMVLLAARSRPRRKLGSDAPPETPNAPSAPALPNVALEQTKAGSADP